MLVLPSPEVLSYISAGIYESTLSFTHDIVLPESSLIYSIFDSIILSEEGIADTDIIEVDFLHFGDFFELIRIVWWYSEYDVALLEKIDISLDGTSIERYRLSERCERYFLTDLECYDLEELREHLRIADILEFEDITIESRARYISELILLI